MVVVVGENRSVESRADRIPAVFFNGILEAKVRVTFRGLDGGQTWLNGFPVRGRTNHPLLFDRELKPKPAFEAVIEVGRYPLGQETGAPASRRMANSAPSQE